MHWNNLPSTLPPSLPSPQHPGSQVNRGGPGASPAWVPRTVLSSKHQNSPGMVALGEQGGTGDRAEEEVQPAGPARTGLAGGGAVVAAPGAAGGWWRRPCVRAKLSSEASRACRRPSPAPAQNWLALLGSHCSSRTMDGSLLAPLMNSSRDSLPSLLVSICLKILSVRFSGVDSSSGIFITEDTIL